MKTKFKPGDTVIFAPSEQMLAGMSETERIHYWGVLGYGRSRPHLYTFICEHRLQGGHCVLISMEDRHIETMRHTDDFRLVTEDET